MAFPANWQKVKRFGQFVDANGNPLAGSIYFQAGQVLTQDGVLIVTPTLFKATLDDTGSFEIELPTTDDATLNIRTWAYAVREAVPGGRSYSMFALTADGDMDIAAVSPVVPPPELVSTKGDKGDQGDPGDVTPAAQLLLEQTTAAATTATNAATTATSEATVATNGATAASTYAGAAQGAATTATNSATAAGTYAGVAQSGATAATTAETTATTQAGIATAAATASANSATASAASAAAIYGDLSSPAAGKGASLVAFTQTSTGFLPVAGIPSPRSVQAKSNEIVTDGDFSNLGNNPGPILQVTKGNWSPATPGGRCTFFNPDSLIFSGALKNSVVVLGGRGIVPGLDGGSYPVTIGPLAELAFVGGGGDHVMNMLAGTICGGAHHSLIQNSNPVTPTGSHGFLGGGSQHTLSGNYPVLMGGTQNVGLASYAVLGGGYKNTIGIITDETKGEYAFLGSGSTNNIQGLGGFIGTGTSNTCAGTYGWVTTGQQCKANNSYSGAHGWGAVSNDWGEVAASSFMYAGTPGDNGRSDTMLGRITTNATQTQLLVDGTAAALLAVGSNTAMSIDCVITCYRTSSPGGTGKFTISAQLSNDTGTLVANYNVATTVYCGAGYSVALVVSGGSYQIRVTGAAGDTVRWTCHMRKVWTRNI